MSNYLSEHHHLDELANQLLVEESITKALPGLKPDRKVVILIDYNNQEYTARDMGVQLDLKAQTGRPSCRERG